MKFIELLLDVLKEQDKSFRDLEDNKIISRKSFYQYKNYTPFLPTILKITNYLNISLDYLANRTTKNEFKKYKIDQSGFNAKLEKELKSANTSKSRLAKDLNIGRSNFSYWKNGSLPKFFMLIEMADYLKCSIDDLLEHE